MDHFDVRRSLDSMVILVDTREQDTPSLRRRLELMNCPWERKKLDFGDYSAKCRLPDGDWLDLSPRVAIERKMSFDELCACFCRGRQRFTKEFERARKAQATVYLLIENASWENAFAGKYRSKMNPKSFIASMTAWLARYRCQLIFCKSETTGVLIHEILYRELKEALQNKGGIPADEVYRTQAYRFSHSVKNAQDHGVNIKYGSDVFAQVVLSLEDLARMVERGIYDLSTWVAGMKYLPQGKSLETCFIALGFASRPTSKDQVKEQYRRLAKVMHPDAGGEETAFIALKNSYAECMEILSKEG